MENCKVIIVDDEKHFKREGQFYWLRSPFFTKTKYILQLDNDIILNGDINYLIESTVNNTNEKIWGVRIKNDITQKIVRTLEELHNFNLTDKILNKWINGGVVLIDVEWYKNYFGNLENFKTTLYEYIDINMNTDFAQIADESFVIKNFHTFMGKMSKRWNLRFQAVNSTKKFIKKDNWFFHFNLRLPTNNKYVKYNFSEILFSKNINIEDESKKIAILIQNRYMYLYNKRKKLKKLEKYSRNTISRILDVKTKYSLLDN